MGTRYTFKAVAAVLAVGVLLLLGASTGSAFAHEIQHAGHHNAGMHGTGICAWMCAAGQGLHSAALPLSGEFTSLAPVQLRDDQPQPTVFQAIPPTRGPPLPSI